MSLTIKWINNINESFSDGQVFVAQLSIILTLPESRASTSHHHEFSFFNWIV
jgi:hypothetical protein